MPLLFVTAQVMSCNLSCSCRVACYKRAAQGYALAVSARGLQGQKRQCITAMGGLVH